jgi:hypothetical protein
LLSSPYKGAIFLPEGAKAGEKGEKLIENKKKGSVKTLP